MTSNDDMDRTIRGEIRLLLAEKRTSASMMSTGVFILIAQLTILGVLISTSQFYKIIEVLHIAIPFSFVNTILVALALYLIIHSFLRIRHYNRLIYRLRKRHSLLADFLDS